VSDGYQPTLSRPLLKVGRPGVAQAGASPRGPFARGSAMFDGMSPRGSFARGWAVSDGTSPCPLSPCRSRPAMAAAGATQRANVLAGMRGQASAAQAARQGGWEVMGLAATRLCGMVCWHVHPSTPSQIWACQHLRMEFMLAILWHSDRPRCCLMTCLWCGLAYAHIVGSRSCSGANMSTAATGSDLFVSEVQTRP